MAKRHVIAIAASLTLAALSATPASALVLTLDPSKTNTPAGGVIDPATGAFNTDSAVFGGQSLADITNFTSAGNPTGAANSFEKGNIFITNFNLGVSTVAGTHVNVNYAIIGTYFIADSGTFTATSAGGAGTYNATAVNQVSVTLYAVPSTFVTANGLPTSAAPLPTAPFSTAPATLAGFGLGNTAGAFALGSATLVPNSGSVVVTTTGTTTSVDVFNAILLFTPAAGTTPATCTGTFPCGFFQGPSLVNFTISATDSLPILDVTESSSGSDTLLSTTTTAGGSLLFLATPAPEPGSLALLGSALLAFGGLGWRLRRKSSDG
jgi:hypothetical protein